MVNDNKRILNNGINLPVTLKSPCSGEEFTVNGFTCDTNLTTDMNGLPAIGRRVSIAVHALDLPENPAEIAGNWQVTFTGIDKKEFHGIAKNPIFDRTLLMIVFNAEELDI